MCPRHHDVERITPNQFILARVLHFQVLLHKVTLRLWFTMTPGGSRSDQSDGPGFKYQRINDPSLALPLALRRTHKL